MGIFYKRLLPISSLAILILITACSNNNAHIQVVDKTTSYNQRVKVSEVPTSGKVVQSNATYTTFPTAAPAGRYVVKQGETLYSLAFNYGKDWRELAAANNIQSPYTIYPGQVISLNGVAVSKPTSNVHSSGSVKVTSTQNKTTPSAAKTTSTSQPKVATTAKPTTAVVGGWTWPAIGTVVGTFSPSGTLNKGVDIAAAEGTPVMAAGAGTVVYAGDNLHGYGNLLIIKHNDSYVSAYAHNRQLLVKEGQKVTVGQKIAEMGSTGADRVKLHFEIRLNGKPVDPLKYLPKK